MKKWIGVFLCLFSFLYGNGDFTQKDFSHLYGMPGFSNELLRMHFKLYGGYVKNANLLYTMLKDLNQSGKGRSYEFGALKRRFGWEFDGMRLHELYFENLGGRSPLSRTSPLYRAIIEQFGSYSEWKQDFVDTGMMRGIGWSVLYLDPQTRKLVNTWINEHDVGHLAGGAPILVMDVFEHAYMPQFGLDKAKYIEVFFNNINWKSVNERFVDHDR